MSRFNSKAELKADVVKERAMLNKLLDQIPATEKLELVTDQLSTKDLLAHRTEWGRKRFQNVPIADVEQAHKEVHAALVVMLSGLSEEELFTKVRPPLDPAVVAAAPPALAGSAAACWRW